MFGKCNHCCFYCGHPFTILAVSLSLVKIKYSVCVGKKRINELKHRSTEEKQKNKKKQQKKREIDSERLLEDNYL